MKVCIIGIDISKKTIDVFVHHLKVHIKVSNNLAGFLKLLRFFSQNNIDLLETVIVMEHTGLYSYKLEYFLHLHNIRFSKVSPLAIKRSMGLVRGKNDKIDAVRIAQYGVEKIDSLTEQLPKSKALERLKLLEATRTRLVREKTSLILAVQEIEYCLDLPPTDFVISSQMEIIAILSEKIKQCEKEMLLVVKSEQFLKTNYEFLVSVKGVGKIVAIAVIIKTDNFTRFTDARKFACYCGVAPFEHTSGSSIRGRSRVSHLADKHMKTLLELAAWSAIQHDKQLKKYYHDRTSKGKSKRNAINVVRNKIIYRMFAVVKQQRLFRELQSAA